MRKKKFSIIAVMLALFLQFSTIESIVKVNATDLTGTFQFITGITLTDGKGNPINEHSNPISKNSEVKLNYTFAIPNETTVKKDDVYIMKIPKEIKIIKDMSFPLKLEDSDEYIGTCTIDTSGNVTIVFSDYAEHNSNVSGYFYVNTYFDESKIGNNNPVPIKFQIGGNSAPVTINVNFEQPEIPDASVKKEGSYDSSKNEITWKVIVNPENVKVNNAQIIDNIREGQEFVPGSVKINGANADETNYSYDGTDKKLIYNFQDVIERQQVISFKTKVTDPKAFENEGATVYEYNKAIFNHDGTTVESNEASVKVVTDFIRKDGKYDAVTKRINWTIYVNNNAQYIENAVVTDDIPEGLTFTPDSVKIDGNLTKDNYTINGQKFTYTFQTAINEPHKIEFSTDVTDEDAFNSNTGKTYNNKVTLTGDGVPGNASDTKGVGVPTSIINKQGVGYNPATGEITWKVTVNGNKIAIKNAVVTDDIRLGQEYVEGSFRIDKGTSEGDFTYVKADSSDKEKTGTLTYKFNDTVNEIHTITFKTKVTDPKVYAGNRNENYYNVTKLTGDNIKPSTSQGTQNIQSQVINKASEDYNYATREITWKVVVNKNKMLLTNAYFTDVIKEGQEFVPNSVNLNGSPAESSNYSYDEGTKTLRYNFPSEIKEEKVITFKTKITDTSVFDSNGEKEFKNTVKLITDLVPGGVESTGTGKIKNTLIYKNADYVKGNSYIDWNVTINSNKILLEDAVITDTLQEGLELDTTSVKLYKQILNSDGSLIKGEEVTLEENSVKYDMVKREFIFTLPSPTSEAYLLTFRTDVTNKSKSPFTNSVSFVGTGISESATSSGVGVIFQGSGGGGVGETGSIKVIKVDKKDDSEKLQGAVFELLDKYHNVIKTSAPTGDDGEILFNKLKFGIDYYVREITPPTGYKLSNETYKFQIENKEDKKNIIYNYENDKITGTIEFYKTGEDEDPLEGAEFKLYKETDKNFEDPLGVAISDKNGRVQFQNVEYGDYNIKETKAPAGYVLSKEILTATVTEEGATVSANPYTISNDKIKGAIEFYKTGEGGKPLEGAEFKLYKDTDKNFENPLATAISDKNGCVQFQDVEYGNYNIKEIKAPTGYYLSSRVLTASINEDGITVHADPYRFSNTKITGNIEFYKTGEDKKPLEGAEFKLYKKGDKNSENPLATAISDKNGRVQFGSVEYGDYNIKETKAPAGYLLSKEILTATISEDGKVVKTNPESISNTKIKGTIEFYKAGEDKNTLEGAEFKLYKDADKNFKNPLATATSDKNGRVQFEGVEYGDYIIKETKAPIGYVISKEVLKATISEDGKVVKSDPYTVYNSKIRGSIKVEKIGENGERLTGAEFTLLDSSENIVQTLVTDKNGLVEFKNVEYGKYSLKETKAPEGYIVSDKKISFEVTEDGKVYEIGSIKNRKIRGKIQVKKTDETGNYLEGAEFTLFDLSENVIQTSVTDKNGLVEFKNVEYGKYTIKETKAPEGYVVSNEKISIEITEDGKTYEAGTITNTKIKATIQIKKLNQDKKPLQGAEFTLYDSEGKVIVSSVSGEQGIAVFERIAYGKYTIKETRVPEGYKASEGIIEISIDKDGEVYIYEVENNRIKGTIEVKKTDMKGNVLQGAEFTLYDKDGNAVATAISDQVGIARFNAVDYGIYTIKETKAPKGYIINKEVIKAQINSQETQKFTVENEQEKVWAEPTKVMPKTGSIINTKILITIGSIAILLGVMLMLKNKNSKKCN
ncbi:SpaA isopeptide-forming pilin-related protein [Clostridium amazonitimonense]|uniref:SpaA isopeptide-forming pilin-related protein n=1 Tax=Clostridium amazonitimonense TaxID=1499689 RepID=UPI000509AC1B|nr:SpaA isopeptide-forming pilin-related protein [Clostridium amazonitimonense]